MARPLTREEHGVPRHGRVALAAARAAIAAAACVAALNATAADEPPAPGAAAPSGETGAKPSRPKIALVLSGGGARGLAHIGVLQVLREARVPVHLIVATSMGAIVGGAYSAGRTPEEMHSLVENADWDRIFSDRPPREDLSFRRKEDDLRLIGRSELGLKPDGVVLPRGAFGSQNLEEFLRVVAGPDGDLRHLDVLSIPLRAVATDLETGQMVVLDDVPLSVAMRASMSVPGAFAPTPVGGRLLGDGGLVRNLPVEVARGLGADVIIAVNVGTPLLPRKALSTAFGVAQQMINILTEQNVAISIAALRSSDILISPDLKDVTFVDFERGAELVERGVAAARAVAGRLASLSVGEDEYAYWEGRRTRHYRFEERPVDAIVVRGAVRSNPDALEREVRERVGVAAGADVGEEQLAAARRVLYGSGEFERVDARSEYDEGKRIVALEVDEKPWGPDYLRFGIQAVSDFHNDGRFSLTLQHTRTWVNAWGAEWRNELQVGDVRRLMTAFYQPLGPGSPWFVEPVLQTQRSSFDLFGPGQRRTDRITNETSSASVALGHRLGSAGVARLRGGYEHYRFTPLITSRDLGTTKDSATFAQLDATFDTLDEPNFPRKGYFVNGVASAFDFDGDRDRPVQSLALAALLPVTFGRLTLLGIVNAGRSRDDRGGFGLGGMFALSGTPINAVSGSQSLFGALLAYHRMGELPRAVGKSWYAGVSLEAGNAWARSSDMRLGDLRKAASVYLGFDTIAGALYLGWGHTLSGDSAFYLFLGRPSDRGVR